MVTSSDDAEGRQRLVAAIHGSDTHLVLYLTGGGVAAVTDLLSVAGASRTVLDVRIPYSELALAELIGPRSAGAVSAEVAKELAVLAHRAADAHDVEGPVIGVGCTAALVTDRTRRGTDRAHIAVARLDSLTAVEVGQDELSSATTRRDQDRIVADRLLDAIAVACGIGDQVDPSA